MASSTISFPTDLMKNLSQLGDRTDEIIGNALEAGGKIVADQVRDNLQSVIGKDTKYESRSNGELVRLVGTSPAKVDKNGNYNVKIGFREEHSSGEYAAKIASVIEYGKHGQPAKPFLVPALKKRKKDAIKKIEQVYEEEVSKIL